MKETYKGYYMPSTEEFSSLWDDCLFALDANVLLNLYRYSKATGDELIDLLQQIKERLWLPHQAGLEYQRNRLKVISEYQNTYNRLIGQLDELKNEIDSLLR